MEIFEKKHIKSMIKIIDGLAERYSNVLENTNISEADRVGKKALGDIIRYMDLSDEELENKLYPLLENLVEGIINWDEEKTFIASCDIKSIHQAVFDKARGVSKESLIQIYNMMP